MRRAACGLLAGAVALAGVSCSGPGRLARGQGRLTVSGEAFVAHPGKALKAVGKSRVLEPGDQVEIRRGEARVDMATGGRLELLAPTRFRFEVDPFLQSGEMLVEPASRGLSVATDDARVTVDTGTTRLSRTLALTVTTYRGRAAVTSPGSEPLSVRAPRRATIAGRGVLPAVADAIPFEASTTDRWDQRFLAEPFATGEQLQRDSEGLAAQLPPGQGHTAAFFGDLLPALSGNDELGGVLNVSLPPSENLVGAAIAERSVTGTFAERWREIFGFRDFGDPATHANVNWGLVAIDVGVDDVSLVGTDVELALGRAPKQFVTAQLAAAPSPASAPATVPVVVNGTTSTSRNGPATTTRSSPTTTTAPPSIVPTTPGVTPLTTPPVTVSTPSTSLPSTTLPPPTLPRSTLPSTVSTTVTAPPSGTPVDRVVDPLVATVNSLLPPPLGIGGK